MDTAPAVLILIDVQQAFDAPGWGARNNPEAEGNIARLLDRWRGAAWPIVHVRHVSTERGGRFVPGEQGFLPKPQALELAGEKLVTKTVNSAFIGTDLQGHLESEGAERLVFVGLTTDHCVSTSVRMAANYGYEVVVVADATATFERKGPEGRYWSAADMHDSALASLSEEFAEVRQTADLLR